MRYCLGRERGEAAFQSEPDANYWFEMNGIIIYAVRSD